MATEVDRLVVVFDADFKRMEEKLNRVIAKNAEAKKKIEDGWQHSPVGAGLNDAIKGVEGLANELPILGAALEALGPAGIVAAVGIGAFIAALEAGKVAAEFGDEIYKASAKVGVSTDTLQEYRFALGEVGGESKEADGAIQGFTETLGKAALGAPKALKAFQSLKLDPKSFGSADEALQAVLERLSEINNESQRQGLAKMLGLEAMVPLARAGAERLAELREEAQKTGQVMDASLVEAAHHAADQFENAAHAAKVQFEAALLPLAKLTVDVSTAIANMSMAFRDLTHDIGDATRLLTPFAEAVGHAFGELVKNNPEIQALLATLQLMRDLLAKAAAAGRTAALTRLVQAQMGGKALPDIGNLYGTVNAPGPPKPGFEPGSIAKPKTTPPDDFKVKRAEIEKQIDTAEKAFLAAYLDATVGVEARAAIQHEMAQKDYEIQQAEIAKEREKIATDKTIPAGAKGDAERAALNTALDAVALQQKNNQAMADEKIDRDLAATIRQQELAHLQTSLGIDTDLFNAQRALARTAIERQKIELQLLELADKRLIAEQQAIIASNVTEDAKADARARIGAIQASQPARRQAIINQTQGPLGGFIDTLPRNIDEVNERMENLAASGLRSVVDGLAGAAAGTQKLGDVFKNIVTQMIADLVRLRLEAALSSVFRTLSGGNPVAAAATLVAGHAQGTYSSAAGMALVGERGPELVRLPGGSGVIPNSALRNVGIGPGGGGGTTIMFDNRGAVIWEQAARQMMAYADRAAMGAGSSAVQIARRSTPTDLARQGGRRL